MKNLNRSNIFHIIIKGRALDNFPAVNVKTQLEFLLLVHAFSNITENAYLMP